MDLVMPRAGPPAVPLAVGEAARRLCLMRAADVVVGAAVAALALSSDHGVRPLECSCASRTSERGR